MTALILKWQPLTAVCSSHLFSVWSQTTCVNDNLWPCHSTYHSSTFATQPTQHAKWATGLCIPLLFLDRIWTGILHIWWGQLGGGLTRQANPLCWSWGSAVGLPWTTGLWAGLLATARRSVPGLFFCSWPSMFMSAAWICDWKERTTSI